MSVKNRRASAMHSLTNGPHLGGGGGPTPEPRPAWRTEWLVSELSGSGAANCESALECAAGRAEVSPEDSLQTTPRTKREESARSGVPLEVKGRGGCGWKPRFGRMRSGGGGGGGWPAAHRRGAFGQRVIFKPAALDRHLLEHDLLEYFPMYKNIFSALVVKSWRASAGQLRTRHNIWLKHIGSGQYVRAQLRDVASHRRSTATRQRSQQQVTEQSAALDSSISYSETPAPKKKNGDSARVSQHNNSTTHAQRFGMNRF